MSSGVPNSRFYPIVVICLTLGWVAGYFHGKDAEAMKESEIATQRLEKMYEIANDQLNNRPIGRADIIKRLRK